MSWWTLVALLIGCGDKAADEDDDRGGGEGGWDLGTGEDSGTPDGGVGDGGVGDLGVDADEDGFVASEDCDDSDPGVHPGADEYCDGIDNDCDDEVDESGAVDAPAWCQDGDGDGYGGGELLEGQCDEPDGDWTDECTDCDDTDVAYHPDAAEEDCTDPNDYDCDGETLYADSDGDGVPACEDCDDDDDSAYPGGTEVCDGADNDCDGLVDDDDELDDGPTWYVDRDEDGYGTDSATQVACDGGDGWSETDDDCDDRDAEVHPGATELCDDDDVDEDCDGASDDDDDDVDASTMAPFFPDTDGDGYGEEGAEPEYYCDAPYLYSASEDDCDDEDRSISPGADEICDDVDNDCDGDIDDDDSELAASSATAYYPDDDGDGFGDSSAAPAYYCEAPSDGSLTDRSDCDDGDSSVHPDASEVCDDEDTDEDCDGRVDDDDDSVYTSSHTTWYLDSDGDGHAGDTETTTACDSPGDDWHAEAGDDCDDDNELVYPGAPERCNEIDEDCDDSTVGGEGVGILWTDGTFEDVTAEIEAASATAPAHFWLYDSGAVASDIYLCEGTWNATFEGQYYELTMHGIGDRDAIILEAEVDYPIIDAGGTDFIELYNFTVTGADTSGSSDGTGGALYVEDTDEVYVHGMYFTGNSAYWGGGAYFRSVDELLIEDSEFIGNSARFGGGVTFDYTDGTIDGCTFESNVAENEGGGIWHRGNGWPAYDLTIVDTTLDGNTAPDSKGGAVFGDNAQMYVSSSDAGRTTVSNNNGGGLVVYETRGYELDLYMTDVDFGEGADENEDFDFWIYGDVNRAYDELGAGFTWTCTTADGCE